MEYGELGWIEIEGFPFWPARRADVLEVSADVQKLGREGLVLVYFFGSHAYGWMEPDKIRPWDDNFEKFTSVGRKGKLFQQALEEAYEWQKESYKKVPTRRRAQMKQRPPDLPSHLLPEKKKHEQALKQMMDLREKEWNKEQKKTKKERGEEVSESKEESVTSKKSVGRPGRKPKKVVEKKQKESDASDLSGSDSDSFVVKGFAVDEDNEDSEDDGLAIFRKELQREFKKESPLPATSETKEPPKAPQPPQVAENKPQAATTMIDLASPQVETETQQRTDAKADLNVDTNGVVQAVNKTPTKPTPNVIRHVPPPCPDCGRKSKILLKSQVPSTSTDYRRKEAGECADSSLGIYLFYMLENHVHNLHDGFKPYKCIFPGCAESFFTDFALRDHIDGQHADFFHLHDSFPRPIMIADQMNLSQDNEDRKENYMDVDEGAKQPQQQGQQANPNAMEIEPNNNSEALPKLEGVKQQQTSSQGPPAEQFNFIENSAEDTVAAKNLVNESDDDDFDAQMEKLKRVNNDTLRCEYPGCEKIFIGFSARADRRKHVEISHLGLKRKPCDDCGRGVYNSLGSDRKRKFQGVKRGRGRPRKYPRPNEYPMAHTTSIISASNMPMNGNAGSSLSNLVIKRGRGRPRKYPRPDEPSTGNSPILQGMPSSAPISINMSGGFQRRGPGRPRKYPLANSPSDPHSPVSSSPVISPINDMHMARQELAGGLPMKKRKGPGRPRKYPRLEGDAHSSQDVNSESEGTPVMAKKKPGYNLAQEAMFRNMAGVPGRPKQPNPFDPKAKRGRGRPRKTDQRREGDYSGPSSAEGSDNEEWGGEGYSSGNEGDISDDEGVRRRRRIGGGPGRPKKPRGSDSDWNPPSYLKKTTIDYSAFFDPNNPNRAADIKNFMSSPVAMNLPPNIIAQMQSMQAAAANNTPATASGQETAGLFVDLVDLCEAEYSRRQPPPGAIPGVNLQPQTVNNSNAATPNVNNNTNTNVNSFNRQF
jgi:hypothetical protein